jgi:hypothetical protein
MCTKEYGEAAAGLTITLPYGFFIARLEVKVMK